MFNAAKESILISILLVVIIIVIFCFFLVYLVYKYKGRKLKLLNQINEMNTRHQNMILEVQLETQERIIGDLAKELHDNVSQKLTLTKLYLNTLPLDNQDAAQKSLEESIDLISTALKDLSDLSKSMSQDLLANHGLLKVVELEVEKLLRSGMYAVHIVVQGNEFIMANTQELVLFRIFQEALSNIIKHARASSIEIRMIYHENSFEMQIEDDGIGFNAARKTTGNGLTNINKRVSYLRGTSSVKSDENGTLITVKLPTNAANYAA